MRQSLGYSKQISGSLKNTEAKTTYLHEENINRSLDLSRGSVAGVM